METLQIRIDNDSLSELKELMKYLKMSKSEIARNALTEGLKRLRMEIATRRYIRGNFTLEKAAEFSRVGIMEMVEYMSEHGVAYFRYDTDELERDIESARKAIGESKKAGK